MTPSNADDLDRDIAHTKRAKMKTRAIYVGADTPDTNRIDLASKSSNESDDLYYCEPDQVLCFIVFQVRLILLNG